MSRVTTANRRAATAGRTTLDGGVVPFPRAERTTGVSRGDPEAHTVGSFAMSKKTKKRKARLRRSKANHGKRPNLGRG